MSEDEIFMKRALLLAANGRGHVSPNPMVGCVIVYNGFIIGEGYHRKYGGNHAEVEALAQVKDKSILTESTVYVSLEPCAHFGKTPPCAPLLVSHGVKRVVIATADPFGLVNGKGIQILQEAGIEVQVGICAQEAKELNKRFFYYNNKQKPYVILKWAETSDGFIARKNGQSKWISSVASRQLVHKWRTEEDSILIGKNTALFDNPHLTSRLWSGKNPKRILLDSQLTVSEKSNIYNNSVETIIFNQEKDGQKEQIIWVKLNEIFPSLVLDKLYQMKIQSVIIEGGYRVLNSYIENNSWNEARVFISPFMFSDGINSPKIPHPSVRNEEVGVDKLIYYYNTSI